MISARQRWQRLQSLFLGLSELPAEQRDFKLQSLSSADQELRLQLEKMLAFDAEGADPLRGAIDRAANSCMMTGMAPPATLRSPPGPSPRSEQVGAGRRMMPT